MKVIYLSVIIAVLAACGNGANRAEAETSLTDSMGIDVVDYSEEKDEEEIFEGGKVFVSEDGRVTIESGVCPDGGTSPDYWAKWTIVNDKGVKHELRFPETSYVGSVHSLRKNDGTTYYIVDCSGKASSSDGYEWLEAYRIVGDTIKEVNVTDGSNKVDDNNFEINYCIPNWYFTTNGAGYDWLFEYDAKSKDLYVPLTKDGDIIDRYEVWHFNGNRFIPLGEQPHKDIHKSLGRYNRLICYFTTKDYIVRVDSLNSHTLRYASWKKPKTMTDKPDIVITGGNRQHHPTAPDELERCDDYLFTCGSYEYIANYCETDTVKRMHQDHLLVRRNGKVVVKQKKEE